MNWLSSAFSKKDENWNKEYFKKADLGIKWRV